MEHADINQRCKKERSSASIAISDTDVPTGSGRTAVGCRRARCGGGRIGTTASSGGTHSRGGGHGHGRVGVGDAGSGGGVVGGHGVDVGELVFAVGLDNTNIISISTTDDCFHFVVGESETVTHVVHALRLRKVIHKRLLLLELRRELLGLALALRDLLLCGGDSTQCVLVLVVGLDHLVRGLVLLANGLVDVVQGLVNGLGGLSSGFIGVREVFDEMVEVLWFKEGGQFLVYNGKKGRWKMKDRTFSSALASLPIIFSSCLDSVLIVDMVGS
jgi:hypothetical protein